MAAPAAGVAVDQTRAAGQSPSRQIRLASAAPVAANDPGTYSTTRRETRIVGGGGDHAPALSGSSQSRARGVGSRFRAAPTRSMARRSEKVK